MFKQNPILATALTIAQLFVCVMAFAQNQDSTIKKPTTFTWSTLISTNANYYGQTAQKKLPFVYSDLTMRTGFGWYASAGGYQLLSEGNFPSEMHLGTGFEFSLSKKVSLSFGYTRSFYSQNSPLLQASNPNSLSAELGVSHWFQTDLTADYNFGKESDFFLSLSNSKTIPLHSFTEQDLLYIKPTITLSAGTQRFYTTYLEEEKRRGNLPDFLGKDLPIGQPEPTYEETTVESTDFKMLSYNFQLPLIWQYKQSALMASYQFSQLNKDIETENRSSSFFSLGYFYQF